MSEGIWRPRWVERTFRAENRGNVLIVPALSYLASMRTEERALQARDFIRQHGVELSLRQLARLIANF